MEIKVLDKAFRLLEAVARRRGEVVSQGELVQEFPELTQPTCARLLKSLAELGYLDQVSRQKGYRLGPLAFYLGNGQVYKSRLVSVVMPLLKKFTQKMGVSALMAIRHNDFRVMPLVLTPPNGIQLKKDQARYDDLFLTATGRMLLALSPEDVVKKIIDKNGVPSFPPWPRNMTEEEFYAELAKIRSAGLLISYYKDRGSIAVPLAMPVGEKPVVLGAVWHSQQPDNEKFEQLVIRELQKTAKLISEKYSPSVVG